MDPRAINERDRSTSGETIPEVHFVWTLSGTGFHRSDDPNRKTPTGSHVVMPASEPVSGLLAVFVWNRTLRDHL